MRIPEEILQNILDAVNLRQLVNESVPLKKRGRNWVGICPFHADRDPSFSVSEDKQIFYCFGCGEGGNAFRFLMKLHGLSFVEAARELASRCGIEIPERPVSPGQKKKQDEREQLVSINERAAEYFHSLLMSGDGIRARDYLVGRGITEEMIRRFNLGWAADEWDGLLGWFREKGTAPEMLEKAGLIIKRKSGTGWYDRFRGRIIFPILDRHGRTVAFGGRILPDAAVQAGNEQPKYLNSPETPVYNKSRELYGFYSNRSAIRRAGSGFVVEGYMDLLALHAAGVHNVVATLGTALTDTHARFLRGLCDEWILLFDGDNAGRKAAFRALPSFYRYDLRVRVLTLDEKDDPDTFIRRDGRDALERLAGEAPSGIDFVIKRGDELHGSDPDGRMQTVEDVITLLDAVSDPVRKNLLASDFARKTGIREDILWERIKKQPPAGRRFHQESSASDNKDPAGKGRARGKGIKNSAESKLLGFILGYPDSMEFFIDAGLDVWLEEPLLREIWGAMTNLHNMNGALSVPLLMEHLSTVPELKGAVAALAREFPPCSEEEHGETLAGLLDYAVMRHKKALRSRLLEEMRGSENHVDELAILKRLQELR
jgi:DNA primase